MTYTLEPSQKPAHRHRRYLLAGPAMVIAVSGGYIGWHYRPAPNAAAAPVAAPQPAIPVTSATAERRDVPIYLTGLGTVRELLRAAASTGAPHHNLPGFTRVHWVPLAMGLIFIVIAQSAIRRRRM